MQLKIVLVRPVYPENLGLAARAMANFGSTKLALVKPECNWKSGKAKSRAMHAQQVLLRAKRFDSIEEATADCSYTIATSAKKGRNKKALSALQIAERFGKSHAKIALVFGPEPSGLTNAEIAECDFIASIAASKSYPTLNLSHAVCVMLYQLFVAGKGIGKQLVWDVKPATKKRLLSAFEESLRMLPSIDDKKTVLASFKAMSSRALLSEKEAKALLAFLSETGKALPKNKWRND